MPIQHSSFRFLPSLCALFILCLTSCTPQLHQNAAKENPDVLIVGAGLAGLSSAYQLQKAGKTALILEMTPHIGGRIRTARYADQAHAEVGLAEFWGNNPALAIFRELDIPLETAYTSFSSFSYQGKLYPFTHDTNLEFLEAFIGKDEMPAYRAWDQKMANLYRQLDRRPLTPELESLQDISFADWIRQQSGLPPKAQEFVRLETEPEFATSWEKISALDGIAEWHIFSGQGTQPYHVIGGNQRAAEKIADAIGRDNIRLNQLVTHIRSSAAGVEVTATDMKTYEQKVYRADYVITAIPLFRLNDIQFDPPLSEARQEAIQTQSGGAYFTAHLKVDHSASRYWTQDGESILPILTDGPLGVIYEGHVEAGKDALLNLLVTGAYAERFNSRIGSPDEIREMLLAALDKQWPGFSPAVKQMTFYRFHPRAIASWPLGRSRLDQYSDALRTPQGRIYFAGDFTEDTHSNGAAHSALRVVKDILRQH
ncbi:flavin monoamine oxidase family protein [Methylomicrobium lacus]|uniref:flavin monoamine oxidase family protein n=1 Tax=Methylomicrobium lacus TaxID=136992 RepID=UPI0035A98EE9